MSTPIGTWNISTSTEARLQVLVDEAVLPPLGLISARAAAGESTPTPRPEEIVVFESFFRRGFGIPSCAFLRGILHFYGLELINLNPNSILQISLFVHLCEAYLGIRPHFDLFRHLFLLKPYPSKKNPKVVGGAGFQLREGVKKSYFAIPLKSSNKGWHDEWFYCINPYPALPSFAGSKPRVSVSWTTNPDDGAKQIPELLRLIEQLKDDGLTGIGIAFSFITRRIQPLRERVNLGYKFLGLTDPTRESADAITGALITARLNDFFTPNVDFHDIHSPKSFRANHPPPSVSNFSPRNLYDEFLDISVMTFMLIVVFRIGRFSFPMLHFQKCQ